MDRFQKEEASAEKAWWQRFALIDRGKEELDRSIDRFIGADFADCDILFVPEDIATTDPSFLHELEGGHFGLDGILIDLEDAASSVFTAPMVDDGFRRALHAFAWLRDLSAADAGDEEKDDAAKWAQHFVFEWMERYRRVEGLAYEPEILTRRIHSFLANANLITRGLDEKRRRLFVRTLAGQIAVLRTQLPQIGVGAARLSALAALALAGICLSRHGDLEAEVAPLLEAELEAQILPDGGHISRNGDALLKLLFELLPLTRCYVTRDHQAPPGLSRALDRMLPMIRFLRMGDSSLARFNGVGATPTDALAILFANDERKSEAAQSAPDSGYARLQAGPGIVLADVGAPPPPGYAACAHAGCLSFEFSVRHFAVVVNTGAYRGDDEEWRLFARATNAHSTLTVDDRSQGDLSADEEFAGLAGVRLIELGERTVEAAHGGYAATFGLVHRRRLTLAADGLALDGVDRLDVAGNVARGAGLPACRIRFHLHPFIEVTPLTDGSLMLGLPDGEAWRFSVKGGGLETDDSVYLAYRRGIEAANQIVVVAEAMPGLAVDWHFERIRERPAPGSLPADDTAAGPTAEHGERGAADDEGQGGQD